MIENPLVLVQADPSFLLLLPCSVMRGRFPEEVKILNLLPSFGLDVFGKEFELLSKVTHTSFK
jgi:hypothetical protein